MKYALVTGGSRGIGRAICVKLASQGYHVLINYVANQAKAEETLALTKEAGTEGEIIKFDVANIAETQAAIEKWQEEHKDAYIDVLVNNAGVTADSLLPMMEPEAWHKVLSTSLDGFFNVTRTVVKKMIRKKHGRIINMASVSGLIGLPGQCNYSAAKGAIIAATKALSKEVGIKNITVNAIAPGFIKTDMTSELNEEELKKGISLGRFGEPEEVAELVAFLASDGAAYITGETIAITGGLKG
ncbi:MAG: 3-oxoacyl-ACP reductase FabG [Bacteroidales bacterium]|nr:3-oxoacyl-ACP reductase FabG [Bacteroidales bacterium]MBR2202481.1 3-oxoacyl-ACP reductase FabG [Bacteroidales bacterium]MBR3713594.1 3-oxoacyl-ACP reductase FabG [Bacteroidales bacterium]